MIKKIIDITRFFLVLAFFFSATACQQDSPIKEAKPTVLVSIAPYAFFVKKIARDTVHIETLVPPGANPHVYEASPKQVQRHHNAVLWIYLGEPFDKKILKFFQDTHKQIEVVDITQGLDLLPSCEENSLASPSSFHSHDHGQDLHIWLSPLLAKLQAQKISAALTALLPEQADYFSHNLQLLLEEIDQVDQKIAKRLKPFQGKTILVSHPAFGYFCREYHLTQLSIEVEGKDPLPQQITQVIEKAKRLGVQSILIEPQYSNKGAELMAELLHLPTYTIDPYAENYLENLLKIARVISE